MCHSQISLEIYIAIIFHRFPSDNVDDSGRCSLLIELKFADTQFPSSKLVNG